MSARRKRISAEISRVLRGSDDRNRSRSAVGLGDRIKILIDCPYLGMTKHRQDGWN
jgi:hypothetical protein